LIFKYYDVIIIIILLWFNLQDKKELFEVVNFFKFLNIFFSIFKKKGKRGIGMKNRGNTAFNAGLHKKWW